MADRSEYKALRKRLARRFNDGARSIAACTPRVSVHLEPTTVHELRVLARRLRALVWAARRVGPRSSCKRLRKMLRIWGQSLGERRTLDVVLQDAAELQIDATSLVEPHSRSADTVRRVVTVEHGVELADLLRKTARKLSDWSEHRLHQGLVLRAQELRKALREAPLGKETQHLLRIEAKKARYLLEAVGRKCEPLKELQGHLGRSHDMEVLQEMLGPHAAAAEIEAHERELAVGLMHEAVRVAEGELRAAAERLRGVR